MITASWGRAVAATVTRLSLVVAVSILAAPLVVEAQSATKVYRIGFLGPASASTHPTRLEALLAGLRDLGYVEGKNIVIEYRWAEGRYDQLPVLAAELVRLKVDVLVTAGTPGISAAKRATTMIPIVMAGSGDAVAAGLVASLARPGGNVTGLTDALPELMAKWLELLKEAVPRTERVAVVANPDSPTSVQARKPLETTARSLNIELHRFEVRRPNELESVFAAMTKGRIDAVLISTDSLFNANVRAIVDLAVKRRLPAAGSREFAEAGGTIGYGVNFSDNHRRAASFVDKILRGAKPADLPVEQPTKFEMVIQPQDLEGTRDNDSAVADRRLALLAARLLTGSLGEADWRCHDETVPRARGFRGASVSERQSPFRLLEGREPWPATLTVQPQHRQRCTCFSTATWTPACPRSPSRRRSPSFATATFA